MAKACAFYPSTTLRVVPLPILRWGGELDLRPQRPQLREGPLAQRRLEVGHARRPARAALQADDSLDRHHMLVAPAGEGVVDVDQLLGQLVERPVPFGIAVDIGPGRLHPLAGPIRLAPVALEHARRNA